MSAAALSPPEVRGWCPGALRPMLSGDGWVVRVRPRGGRLDRDQVADLARLARICGSGVIDLSARANIQLRGIREVAHPALLDGLAALGLVDDTPEGEARRNIVVTPFWDKDDGTRALAAGLEAALTTSDLALPGKFGFALDTGRVPVLRATSADIRIERAGDEFLVYADGAATGALATAATVGTCALELAHWFLASGGASGGRGRMARHVGDGAQMPADYRAAVVPAISPITFSPGLVPQGALLAFAFGQTDAATLDALATLGALRLTPWRMVLVEGLRALPDIAGILTDLDDPLLRVVACTGSPGCPQALAPTRALARRLAPLVPLGHTLHVSGCAKGCAHPGPALTLTATTAGFALIRHGLAADAPEALLPETDLAKALTRGRHAPHL